MITTASASRRIAPVVLAALAVLAVPATASALSVKIDRPCYSHIPTRGSQPIVGTITGGTPGADFIFTATDPGKGLGSAGSVTGTFDAAGNAVASITDVFPPSGSISPLRGQTINLSVTDYGTPSPTDVPVGKALITNVAMDVSSHPTSPRKPRLVRISGTPFAHKSLYGFITKPGKTHVLRRFPLGKGNVCGYAAARRIVAPAGFHRGHYYLYVNAGPKLRPRYAIRNAFRIYAL